MTDRRKRKKLCQPRHRSCKINIRFLLSMKNKKPRSCIMIGTNQQIRGTTRLEKLGFSPLRIRDICGAMGNGRAPRRSLPSVAALRSALGSPFTAAPLPRFHRPRLAEKGLTPATPLPHRFGFSNSIYPSDGFVKSFFAFFQKKRGRAPQRASCAGPKEQWRVLPQARKSTASKGTARRCFSVFGQR